MCLLSMTKFQSRWMCSVYWLRDCRNGWKMLHRHIRNSDAKAIANATQNASNFNNRIKLSLSFKHHVSCLRCEKFFSSSYLCAIHVYLCKARPFGSYNVLYSLNGFVLMGKVHWFRWWQTVNRHPNKRMEGIFAIDCIKWSTNWLYHTCDLWLPQDWWWLI